MRNQEIPKRSEMSEQNSMRASASEFLNWIMLGGFVALAATTGKLPEDPKKAPMTITEPLAREPVADVGQKVSVTPASAHYELEPNEVLLGRITIPGSRDETTIDTAPVRSEEIDSMLGALRIYTNELQDPKEKVRVSMLSEGTIRTACRFASDWFVKENAHLTDVLSYLEKRSGAWTPEFTAVVKKVIGQSMGYVKDEPALMAMVQAKLKEGQPFKCGFLLNMAQYQLTTMQALSVLFLTEAAGQIEKDSKSDDLGVREDAKKASKALVESIATAMGDK
jgi:hypothetical protein